MDLWKYGFTFMLSCLTVWFIWQYNFVPFQINAKINKASNLVDRKYCGQALSLMDNALTRHSFLDSYARIKYGEFIRICNSYYPENNITYIKRGLELINEAIKIQPLYTRYWIFMGSATNTLAEQEKNTDIKNNLIKEAGYYLDRALQLAPKHQEILLEQAKIEIVVGNYEKMQKLSKDCIELNTDFPDCWWYLALSKIYLRDSKGALENMKIAASKGYSNGSQANLLQLANAYGAIKNYQDLVYIYKELIKGDPNFVQYHSSLAFFYRELGEYGKAREETMLVLQLSPESKPNVDAFLKTLK